MPASTSISCTKAARCSSVASARSSARSGCAAPSMEASAFCSASERSAAQTLREAHSRSICSALSRGRSSSPAPSSPPLPPPASAALRFRPPPPPSARALTKASRLTSTAAGAAAAAASARCAASPASGRARPLAPGCSASVSRDFSLVVLKMSDNGVASAGSCRLAKVRPAQTSSAGGGSGGVPPCASTSARSRSTWPTSASRTSNCLVRTPASESSCSTSAGGCACRASSSRRCRRSA
mmetsp:Transcript_3154/g.7770  ORF Transcript_3154/g.7770 Transcript_3154/m.7770 type:complete len:240 (+) Transcript_3154:370-1089(+)